MNTFLELLHFSFFLIKFNQIIPNSKLLIVDYFQSHMGTLKAVNSSIEEKLMIFFLRYQDRN